MSQPVKLIMAHPRQPVDGRKETETVTLDGLARTVDNLAREMHGEFESVNERIDGMQGAVNENTRKIDLLLDHFGIES